MAGRPKVKLYQYSKEGKYLGFFETVTDVHKKYYEGKKYPLFGCCNTGSDGKDRTREYHELPDGTYIARYRIGREKLMAAIKLHNDPFCREDIRSKPIVVYNRLGKKIAAFRSIHIAVKLTGMDSATLLHRCTEKPNKIKNKPNKDGLTYKFKK